MFSDAYHPTVNGVVYVIDILRANLEALGHEVYIIAPKSPTKRMPYDPYVKYVQAYLSPLNDKQYRAFFFPPQKIRQIGHLNLDVVLLFTIAEVGLLGMHCALKFGIPVVNQYGTDILEYMERYPIIKVGLFALPPLAPLILRKSPYALWQQLRAVTESLGEDETRTQAYARRWLTVLHEHCDLMVSVSDKIAVQLKELNPGVKVLTIATGVDRITPRPLETALLRKRLGIARQDFVVLYVGRLGEEKNLPLLLNGFNVFHAQNPQSKLVLIGDSDFKPKLEALAEKLESHTSILFAGRLPREKLGSAYALGSVFVFPSLTDTQGLVLNEAAHAGLPLVWVDSDSLNSVLTDGVTGYRAPDTAEGVAEAIQKVARNSAKRQAMGLAAKRRALAATELIQTEKLAGAMQRLLDDKSYSKNSDAH
jgi:1,2-diacylglycerol 3-alpha-glucosyltransferase